LTVASRASAFPVSAGLALAASLGLCTATAAACQTKTVGTGATDPEHQSVSEYNLGLDAFQHADFRVALQHALRAVQLDDQNARATYLTSLVYQGFCGGPRGFDDVDCHLGDAEKYARMTMKLAPTYLDANNLLGEVLINEKRFPEAIAVLKPLTTDPSFTSIHLAWGNLGWAQVLSGDLEAGIASLKNSVTEPRFVVGFYRLGIAYEKKGDLAQADANLTSAVDGEAGKSFQDAFEERGKVRAKLGQPDLAKADFERCKALAPDTLSGKRCADALAGSGPVPSPAGSNAPTGGKL
jgi:Tfp pilus assembly protein PilF